MRKIAVDLQYPAQNVSGKLKHSSCHRSISAFDFFFFMMEGGTFLGTELRATSMLVGSKGHTGGKMKEGNNKY